MTKIRWAMALTIATMLGLGGPIADPVHAGEETLAAEDAKQSQQPHCAKSAECTKLGDDRENVKPEFQEEPAFGSSSRQRANRTNPLSVQQVYMLCPPCFLFVCAPCPASRVLGLGLLSCCVNNRE